MKKTKRQEITNLKRRITNLENRHEFETRALNQKFTMMYLELFDDHQRLQKLLWNVAYRCGIDGDQLGELIEKIHRDYQDETKGPRASLN